MHLLCAYCTERFFLINFHTTQYKICLFFIFFLIFYSYIQVFWWPYQLIVVNCLVTRLFIMNKSMYLYTVQYMCNSCLFKHLSTVCFKWMNWFKFTRLHDVQKAHTNHNRHPTNEHMAVRCSSGNLQTKFIALNWDEHFN